MERFNLQSGMSRGSYQDTTERRSCAHEGEVVGIACDSTNTLMISAGYQGDIKVNKSICLIGTVIISASLVFPLEWVVLT